MHTLAALNMSAVSVREVLFKSILWPSADLSVEGQYL